LLGDYLKLSDWYRRLSEKDKAKLEEAGVFRTLNNQTYWKDVFTGKYQVIQCMAWNSLLANLDRSESPINTYAFDVNLPGELLKLPEFSKYKLVETKSLDIANLYPGKLFITDRHVVQVVANDGTIISISEGNKDRDGDRGGEGLVDTYDVSSPLELSLLIGTYVYTD